MYEELAYCVPLGIPHSRFLSWDPDDQDKALAWLRQQAKVCKGCGTRLEQWDGNPYAFVGDLYKCPGCETMELERNNIPKDAKGVYVRLVPQHLAPEVDERVV